jgi:heat shock protein HtpX
MGGFLRTTLLMAVLTGMLLGVGGLAGYLLGVPMTYALGFALILAVMLNLGMFFYADRWVLRLYRAKLVSESEAPRLHEIIGRVAANARLPKPKVAVIPLEIPNAFATGRSPSKSVVAVTRGALELLDEDELEGVIGHEMAHIKNRDMLINTLAAMIGAAIVYLMYFSFFAGGSRDREGGAGLLALLGLLLAPFAVMLVRLAISRGREHGADKDGATISRKPLGLANALRKLEARSRGALINQGNPSTSHLFIVNPFRSYGLSGLFATHPPTEERIKRLEWLAKTGKY